MNLGALLKVVSLHFGSLVQLVCKTVPKPGAFLPRASCATDQPRPLLFIEPAAQALTSCIRY